MAAVRARRGVRGVEPPHRGRRQAPPSYSGHGAMPRLARIKLGGGIGGDEMQVSGRSLMVGVAGLLMFCGVAVAGAAWLGSSLFDAREAFNRTADVAAAGAGFSASDIDVTGVDGARKQEVQALIAAEGRQSILALDPAEVKSRIESLDWVASAQVQRMWPHTLAVHVEHRQAYALWREDGVVSVIDYNGERLLSERAADHADLPVVIGRGAGPAAGPLLVALEDLPRLRQRLEALERVGDWRWNVRLKTGAVIALPEEGAPDALRELEGLQAQYALLDRPVRALDLRAPGRLAVRVNPALAGGRAPVLGGA